MEPEQPTSEPESQPHGGLWARTDTQIWLGLFVGIGLAVGLVLFPDDWSIARKLAGGVLLGVGATFCVFMPRMIGGRDFN
ncbi:MAG: hypothetical protein KTR31_28810 [Myxococcales bacterium]|nr:hypothetical protein [Myxococcales bacterium]